MEISVKELLFEKFLEWQKSEGEIKTQKEFADHIGISEASLNHIMSGRRPPSRKNIEYLAVFFADLRFYDCAGISRPDPRLQYINRHWGELKNDEQDRISEEFDKYTTEKLHKDQAPPTDQGTMGTDP